MAGDSIESRRDRILPIDRPGWGWIVVLAAAGLFGLQAGGFKCAGVILVELIEQYDGIYSPATLIWIFSIKFVLCGLMSPLVSILIIKLTHRVVSLLGVFLMSLSYVGLAYSGTLAAMILSHSVVGGFGEVMVFLPAMLVSAQYFKKRRASALGVIAAGSGVGTFILPSIIRALYDNYNYTGATLLYGGFVLQFMVLASLLRPLSFYERVHAKELAQCETDSLEEEDSSELITEKLALETPQRVRSVSFNHPTKHSNGLTFHSQSKVDSTSNSKLSTALLEAPKPDNHHMASIGDLSGSAYFEDSTRPAVDSENNENTDRPAKKEKFDLKVLLMPKFLMFGIALCLYVMGMSVVYSLLPSLGKECGIPKDTVALMMVLGGVLEIPSRVVNGVVADRHYMTAYNQQVLYICLAGLMILLCAIFSGLPGMILALFGMSTMGTSIFSLIPLVLRELVGPENVTSGMGLQMVFQAFGFTASSFIAGQIYEFSGSWRYVYFYVSAASLGSSLVLWPYSIHKFCKNRKKADQTELPAP